MINDYFLSITDIFVIVGSQDDYKCIVQPLVIMIIIDNDQWSSKMMIMFVIIDYYK